MNNKIGVSIPADKYHQHQAVGHSGLVRIMRSPAHYRAWLDHPPEPTPQMLFGTAFHAALLEPEKFGAEYAIAPKFDRRTKEGKAQAETWEAENAGKTPLTVEQMSAIEKMVVSVRAHAGAESLLAEGVAEMSAFWIDPETGVECKCRPDWMQVDGGVQHIVDVKTTCDASAEGFARAIATLGYDVQAALYVDGIEVITGCKATFLFIAVEKDPPYAAAVYKAADEVIEVGRTKYRGALQLLKWCRENDRWPAYQPNGEIETINLPRWAAKFDLEG
ncbi:PD-(D/E)XK nuclease-like domain-containing protein [Methylococcus capsulatus]|jgi:hypothetical protein|uniref:PD-(D/E)XK nuclease-like domain-containing protein n=1 Tax=Methylococcus capsulatus TaxID=414 RepID=UPI001C530AAE|nr:PD-(D/E)XK nuclease-like domain-containing protein [Methylococcus capsulatus]QXP89647.1 PD-(D/E)XK nuclease-like domain-containing protein [Methylococcus capsulatus]